MIMPSFHKPNLTDIIGCVALRVWKRANIISLLYRYTLYLSISYQYTPNNIGQIRLVKTRHDTRYLGNDPVRIILYLTEIQHDSDPIFLPDL